MGYIPREVVPVAVRVVGDTVKSLRLRFAV
jgi:hypothetical protein